MKKGMIIEMDDSYLTLLTPEGEFCRAHKQNLPYTVGEEIYFFPIMDQQRNKLMDLFKSILKLKSVWMSIAVLLVFLGSVVPVYQSNRAYAYVSIDVNPSIELGLNKEMKVVELTGYNKEGENIVSRIPDWKKKDVTEITKRILTELKREGFVKDKPIIISTVGTEKLKEKVELKLEQNIKEIKQTVSNQQFEVNMVTTTKAELEKAHDLGVTAGKYQEVKKELTEKKQNKAQNQNKNKYTNKAKDQNKIKNPNNKKIPPGQLKKQDEAKIKEKNRSEGKAKENFQILKPPGQQKKIDGDKGNNNKQQDGKKKKHSNEKRESNKNENRGKNN